MLDNDDTTQQDPAQEDSQQNSQQNSQQDVTPAPAEGAASESAAEAPAKKPAKKTAAKRTAKKASEAPAKKTAAKRTTKKAAAEVAPEAPAETTSDAVAPADAAAPEADEAPVEKPKRKTAARKRTTKAAASGDPAAEGTATETAAGETGEDAADGSAAPMVLFQAPEATRPARKRTSKRAAAKPAAKPAAQSAGEQSAGEQTGELSTPGAEDDEDAVVQAEAAAETGTSETGTSETGTTEPGTTDDAGTSDADESVADESGADDSDDSGDSEGAEGEGSGEGGPRRRRRRGGRRRRKPSDGGGDAQDGKSSEDEPDGGDGDDESSSDGAAKGRGGRPARATEGEDEASEDADGSDAEDGSESTGSRRRRRRRRSDGNGSDGDDNGGGRARAPRNPEDEITSIGGSTRLEAKKQRRREGREAGRRRAPIVSEAEFLARREAVDRVMVIRQRDDLTQIGVLEDKVLVEHYVARESQTSLIGNVYLGRVQNVLPSMEAAFIDIGKGRNAVLYAGEVNWAALGHKDGQPRKIESVLTSGQTILVQVTKDPVGHKGARLTGQISLPGRFLVYVPDGTTSGISRKLPDTERNRLKTLLKDIVPESAGVIVRTAAEGASEDELTRDVERLTARWQDIEQKVQSGRAPELLYGEPDLTLKVVRDLFTEDFARLVIQGDDAWDLVDGYVSHVAPDLRERLERFEPGEDGKDIFAAYRVDEQIAKGLDRKVWLPSGGSLVIDRTEAMTVVDVNTGKFTGSGGNLEETVTKNNLEAAEEIVRQLRLRDIGGIIVIDFIDMVLESNRELVLRRLVECLGRDRTRHQVAEVTSLGLVQMTRKRIGTGLLEAFSHDCEHCKGRGVVVVDQPVEPGGRVEDEEPRGRRGARSGRGGRGGRGGDQGGGNGSGGQDPQPAAKPSPRDLAGSRPTEKPAEDAAAPSGDRSQAGTTDAGEPKQDEPRYDGQGTAPETATTDVAENSPQPVETTPVPDEPTEAAEAPEAPTGEQPAEVTTPEAPEEEPQAPAAPEPPRVVTTSRRRTARRPAGPPPAAAPAEPMAASSASADGSGPESEEESSGGGSSLLHVPIKRRGRKR